LSNKNKLTLVTAMKDQLQLPQHCVRSIPAWDYGYALRF
jgi:hypothetical protein